jgi:uncharacterized membrane protein
MFSFIKTALLRGLVILIPVVLVFLTLRELVEIMIQFATPIADLFPPDFILEGDPLWLIALLLILATALLLGLLWSSSPTRRAIEWVEDQTIGHLPMYRMMKSLVAAFLNLEDEKSFKPACLRGEDGSLDPVYVIEEHGDDMVVVLQPWTPTAFAGSLKVVRRDRVQFVPVTLDDFSLALTHFGVGLSENLKKAETNTDGN